MTVQGLKSEFVFSRNPVLLKGDAPQQGQDVDVSLTLGEGDEIYSGSISRPYSLEVSEILDANAPYFAEVRGSESPVKLVESLEQMRYETNRYCTAMINGAMASFYVIPGGVSKQNFRRYQQLQTDAFAARFLNPRNNFFLTTRTAGWKIIMKETELYPLYFINRTGNNSITLEDTLTHWGVQPGMTEPGVYVLDLEHARGLFLHFKGILPAVFDVKMGDDYACRIIIERSDISRERYRLKFRNSLGVFEIMEITGDLTFSPKYSDQDDSAAFRRYDPDTGDFYSTRERLTRGMSVTVATGVKRPDEIRMLMDLIGSDEVYLLDLTDTPTRVIPTVENMKYSPRPETPQTFDLKLEFAEDESNIMQDIIDGLEGRKPRVFSKQFSKQFN